MSAQAQDAPQVTLAQFAQLAARLCATPIASLSVRAADGYHVLASVGLASGQRVDDALYAVVADADDVIVRRDAAAAELIAGCRFVAATALRGPDHIAVGVLCIADTATRGPDDGPIDALRMTSHHAVMPFVIEQRLARLQPGCTDDDRFAGLAGQGAFEVDVASGAVVWSTELRRMHQLPVGTGMGIPGVFAAMHPDDRPRLERLHRAALRDHRAFRHGYRIVRNDGAVRAVESHGRIDVAPDGQAARISGVVHDVTERDLLFALGTQLDEARRSRAEAEAARNSVQEHLDTMTVRTASLAPDGRILTVNAAVERGLNVSAARLIGTPVSADGWCDHLPEVRDGIRAAFERARRGERVTEEMRSADARLLVTLAPVHAPDGSITRVIVEGIDVTAQRHAEELLERSQRTARIGGWERDFATGEITTTGVLLEMFGLDVADSARMRANVHPEDLPRLIAAVEGRTEPGLPWTMRIRTIDAGGTRKTVEARGICELGPLGEPVRASGTLQDITAVAEREEALRLAEERAVQAERDLAEEHAQRARMVALEESHQRLQSVIDGAPVTIYAKGLDLRYLFANRAFELLLGLRRGGAAGLRDEDLFSPDVIAITRGNDLRVLEGGESLAEEETVEQDGEPVTYFSQKFPLRDAEGTIYAVCGISADITEAKRAEASGRRRADRQVLLSKLATEALVQQVEAVERAAGLVVQSVGGVADEDDAHFLESVARVVAGAREREHARELETQLARSRRLESIGKLAGGVAHDFNNLLAVILNYAAFVHEGLHDTDVALRADVTEITTAAQRAAHLTRDLLAFSRRDNRSAPALDVNAAISRASSPLADLLGADIELITDLDPGAGAAGITHDELEEILLGLGANARDAMTTGGTLTVSTAGVDLDGSVDPNLTAGPYLRVTVSDTGIGMTPEVLERAVDPFFSTKPVGAGSGLGLATAYGIVQRAGGRIQIESRAGHGTTVTVDLPVDPAPDGTQRANGPGERPATILLVEDEDGVRHVVERILVGAGYRVLPTDGPDEARRLAATERFDLLLTDIVMPLESGRDLAASLLESRDIGVVYMSGYSQEVLGDGAHRDKVRLIEKPFSRDDVLSVVADTLAQRP